MAIDAKLITIAEFEAFIAKPENSERRFELINGEVIEKMPTEEHGVIASNLHGQLFIYLQQNKIGRLIIEGRFKIPDDEHNARLPDIAFTRAERALPVTKHGAVPQMPDLAVEIKSPTDSVIAMREKALYYLKNGASMVWLVYPEKATVEIHTPEDLRVLASDDHIDGGDVLPGFSLLVSDIFLD